MRAKSQSAISRARRERERDALKTRIKDIARKMFVREGYEAVTFQKIATSLEYTHPALYRYFQDKNDLLSTIVLEDMEDLHAQLLECASIADPLDRLIAMAHTNGVWAIEHPNHYLLFYSQAWTAQEDEVRAARSVALDYEPLHVLYSAIEELLEQGRVKGEYADAALLAKTLLAGMHGVIMLEITISGYDRALIHDRDRSFPEHLDAMIGGLMHGLLKV
ncbi:MAG: putative HTH-type transcriptional regulator [Candidatus Hydrogenedentes bacterium ADurb.Bin101]|jgi:AcrR family transcriptional regulator|nr:MAG: putative HTH-type transcriptional regulator [Candidatus Hydrogenedentes bacterium ADurb.Bin101]HOC68034.1 TetR/AcrR family transcriptional regulator [Candidatus Hydrogenedentota bacterium]